MDADQVHQRLQTEAAACRQRERDEWFARRKQEETRDWMILNHLRAILDRAPPEE